jgi:hypothetical protein
MYCGVDVVVRQAIQLVPGNVKNLFALAETASASSNHQEAYNYFTKVLEIEPKNSKAWLGKGTAAGWLSKLDDLRFTEMTVAYGHAMTYAAESEKEGMKESCSLGLNAVAIGCYVTARKHMLEFISLPNAWAEYVLRCRQVISLMEVAHAYAPKAEQVLENIILLCKDNIEGVTFVDTLNGNVSRRISLSDHYEKETRAILSKYAEKLKELRPDYVPPEPKRPSAKCFVVTATLGDESHPYVCLLREFRDEALSTSALGKRLLDWYYTHGPGIAVRIGRSKIARLCSLLFLVVPSVALVRLYYCCYPRRDKW